MDDKTITLSVVTCAAVSALLQIENGHGANIICRVTHPSIFRRNITEVGISCNEDGHYRLDKLQPETTYKVSASLDKDIWSEEVEFTTHKRLKGPAISCRCVRPTSVVVTWTEPPDVTVDRYAIRYRGEGKLSLSPFDKPWTERTIQREELELAVPILTFASPKDMRYLPSRLWGIGGYLQSKISITAASTSDARNTETGGEKVESSPFSSSSAARPTDARRPGGGGGTHEENSVEAALSSPIASSSDAFPLSKEHNEEESARDTKRRVSHESIPRARTGSGGSREEENQEKTTHGGSSSSRSHPATPKTQAVRSDEGVGAGDGASLAPDRLNLDALEQAGPHSPPTPTPSVTGSVSHASKNSRKPLTAQYQLDGLEAARSYEIQLAVYDPDDDFLCPWSDTLLTHTHRYAPLVTDLTLTSTTHKEAVVSWSIDGTPADEPVESFIIDIAGIQGDKQTLQITKPLAHVESEGKKRKEEPGVYSVVVDVQPASTYLVKCKARTCLGDSETIATKEITSLPLAPSVSDLQIKKVKHDNLQLAWTLSHAGFDPLLPSAADQKLTKVRFRFCKATGGFFGNLLTREWSEHDWDLEEEDNDFFPTSYTLTGLEPETDYVFQARAFTRVGASEWSILSPEATTKPVSPALVDTVISLEKPGRQKLTIRFTVPDNPEITGFMVRYRLRSDSLWQDPIEVPSSAIHNEKKVADDDHGEHEMISSCATPELPHAVSLAPGATYFGSTLTPVPYVLLEVPDLETKSGYLFSVASRSPFGVGTYTDPVTLFTLPVAPEVSKLVLIETLPTALRLHVTLVGMHEDTREAVVQNALSESTGIWKQTQWSKETTIRLEPIINEGKKKATEEEEHKQDEQSAGQSKSSSSSDIFSCTITNLAAASKYCIRLAAVSPAGTGVWSKQDTFSTWRPSCKILKPSLAWNSWNSCALVLLKNEDIETNTVKYTDAPLAGFEVVGKTKAGTEHWQFNENGDALVYIKGLLPDMEYRFQARGMTQAGVGEWSPTATCRTLAQAPNISKATLRTAGHDYLTLQWSVEWDAKDSWPSPGRENNRGTSKNSKEKSKMINSHEEARETKPAAAADMDEANASCSGSVGSRAQAQQQDSASAGAQALEVNSTRETQEETLDVISLIEREREKRKRATAPTWGDLQTEEHPASSSSSLPKLPRGATQGTSTGSLSPPRTTIGYIDDDDITASQFLSRGEDIKICHDLKVVGYDVRWAENNSTVFSSRVYSEPVYITGRNEITLESLKDATSYVVEIRSVTKVGVSPWSSHIFHTTVPTPPPEPPTIIMSTATQLTISFVVNEGDEEFVGFEVMIHGSTSDTVFEISLSEDDVRKNGSRRVVTLNNLESNNIYVIQIRGITSRGNPSSWSAKSEPMKTREHVRDHQVSQVNVFASEEMAATASATRFDEENLGKKVQGMLEPMLYFLVDAALGGIEFPAGGSLPSVKQHAETLILTYGTPQAAIDFLVEESTGKRGEALHLFSGNVGDFLIGLIPIAGFSAVIVKDLWIKIRRCALIAELSGHDAKDVEVLSLIFTCIIPQIGGNQAVEEEISASFVDVKALIRGVSRAVVAEAMILAVGIPNLRNVVLKAMDLLTRQIDTGEKGNEMTVEQLAVEVFRQSRRTEQPLVLLLALFLWFLPPILSMINFLAERIFPFFQIQFQTEITIGMITMILVLGWSTAFPLIYWYNTVIKARCLEYLRQVPAPIVFTLHSILPAISCWLGSRDILLGLTVEKRAFAFRGIYNLVINYIRWIGEVQALATLDEVEVPRLATPQCQVWATNFCRFIWRFMLLSFAIEEIGGRFLQLHDYRFVSADTTMLNFKTIHFALSIVGSKAQGWLLDCIQKRRVLLRILGAKHTVVGSVVIMLSGVFAMIKFKETSSFLASISPPPYLCCAIIVIRRLGVIIGMSLPIAWLFARSMPGELDLFFMLVAGICLGTVLTFSLLMEWQQNERGFSSNYRVVFLFPGTSSKVRRAAEKVVMASADLTVRHTATFASRGIVRRVWTVAASFIGRRS